MTVFLLGIFLVPAAPASTGYEPDSVMPLINVQGELPSGIAIDQSNQRIYVSIAAKSQANQEFGQIEQLESNGIPTASSPFTLSSEPLFSGVAVNPVTHGIYAAEFIVTSPVGVIGRSRVDEFSSTGTSATQFATNNPTDTGPRIATDSSGNLYYPYVTEDTVQVFNASGALLKTISCSGCPGAFNEPVEVALDSNENLYVVDHGNDRVVKLQYSGGSYSFSSVIQSGRHAVSVAVDPSNNNVFVGDSATGDDYHFVAYDSSGAQFDDFGAGIFTGSSRAALGGGQVAVNATTHKLYITDPDARAVRVFSLVTIHAPTVTTNAASSVGQITAKLNATVNANMHATIDCHFDYATDADFQATGYSNATSVPCPSPVEGSTSTPVSVTLSSLPSNTTYHYRMVAANNAGSVEGNSQVFTTLPVASATVTAQPATAVKQTTATLAGKVNPHGGSVSNCHFEYGVGLSYSQSISCGTAIGPVTTDVSVSPKISGLSASTNYHFRLVVTTNAGQVVGSDGEFTTLPLAPVVTTEPASGITQATATLTGQVNPSGGATTCHFDYGPTISYGSSAACGTDPGSGGSAVAELAGLSGLSPGTTYHYRLVAANAGGTTNGTDLSFTTEAMPPPPPPPPPTETQPSPPPPVVSVNPPPPLKCKRGFQKKRVRGKLRCVKKRRRHRRR